MRRPTAVIAVALASFAVLLVAVGQADAPEPEPETLAVGASPRRTPPAAELPGGGRRIFAGDRILVAHYGSPHSPAMGVLGERKPKAAMAAIKRAARPFASTGRPVLPVAEVIVTVAHPRPGPGGHFNGDVPRQRVRAVLEAARAAGVLVVLDIQPGTQRFLPVVKRWEWALRQPGVSLALDPEWRMPPGVAPGRRIGSVGAAEVNEVVDWLAALVRRHGLPEKVLVVHQFRRDMVRRIGRIRSAPGVVLVQHVDGFGRPAEKMATYHHVLRPGQFKPGFKLFLDEDTPTLKPKQVLRIKPKVSFVSYQ